MTAIARINVNEDSKIINLFPSGDYYEAYGDDAITLGRTLRLTVTNQCRKGAERFEPMCGIPAYRLDSTIEELRKLGHDAQVAKR